MRTQAPMTNSGATMRKKGRRLSAKASRDPPALRTNLVVGHVFRFVSTDGTKTDITSKKLLAAAGNICNVANSSVISFWQSVKVNRVSIWSPPASQGANATCTVEWVGAAGAQASSFEVSDTTVSTAIPAHVTCVPPQKSLAAFWAQQNATVLFNITAPVGSVIDISLSLVALDNNTLKLSTVVSTAALGNVYYLALDGPTTNRFTPISLTTTS